MKAEHRIKFRNWMRKIVTFLIVLLILFIIVQIITAITKWTYNPVNLTRNEEITKAYDSAIFSKTPIDEDKKEENVNVIKQFVELANNKDYNGIYDMLTNDYKQVEMKELEDLQRYVDNNFETQKAFSYQNLVNSDKYFIYKVKIYNDLMLSGDNTYNNVSQKNIILTINEEEKKISLNGFIAKQNLNISMQNEYINFKILEKEIYYENANFIIQIENVTNDAVLAMYKNDIEYLVTNDSGSSIKEINMGSNVVSNEEFILLPGQTETIKLQYKRYMPVKNDYSLNISKIYRFNLENYLEVLYSDTDIIEKAQETYSNIYITL